MRSIKYNRLLTKLAAITNLLKIAGESSFIHCLFIIAFILNIPAIGQKDTSCISDPEFSLTDAEQLVISKDPEIKLSAALKIRECRSENFSRIALPLLKDQDLLVRAAAVTAIRFLPPDEASSYLIPLLKDPSDFIRRETAYVLGKIGSNTAVNELIQMLADKEEIEIRSAAITALGKIGSADAVSALIIILEKRPREEDEFIRRSVARAIGQIAEKIRFGRTDTASPHSFLPPEHKPVFNSDVSLLISNPQFNNVLSVLINIVNNNNEAADTKREAVYAIGSIGDPSAIPLIEKLIENNDPFISETAREALQKLRSTSKL